MGQERRWKEWERDSSDGTGSPGCAPRRYLAGSAGLPGTGFWGRAWVRDPSQVPVPSGVRPAMHSRTQHRASPGPAPPGPEITFSITRRYRGHHFPCHPSPRCPRGSQPAHDTMKQAKGSCDRLSSTVPAWPEPRPHVLPGGGAGW